MSEANIGPGVVIGKGYKLEESLGETSLGELFLATRESDGAKVRVEVLSGASADDPEKVQRLLHEIELIASLQHDAILQALDAGQDDDIYFLVTACEEGQSLEKMLEGNNAIEEKEALGYFVSIVEALKYAWDTQKVLHRDLKPATIFISNTGKAKLTGFGIAKSSESMSMGLTGVGFTIGTPEYMSPEQIRAEGDLDFRSDIYGVGCALYESVTGSVPFSDSAPVLVMHKHMDEDLEPANQRNPAVSQPCADLIAKMMAKRREDRHASWEELLDHMKAVLRGDAATPAAGKAAPARAAATPMPAASGSNSEASGEGGGFPLIPVVIGIIVVIVLLAAVIVMSRG